MQLVGGLAEASGGRDLEEGAVFGNVHQRPRNAAKRG